MQKKLIFILSGFIFLASFNRGIPFAKKIRTKAQLGEKLFNEKILSADSSVSCASCHKPEFAFADTAAFSIGINNTFTKRNTPSVLNMLNRTIFFYDGRAKNLEDQALRPIEHKDEMGLPINEAVKRLNENKGYKKLFLKLFNTKPNAQNLAEALAAFERTLETVDSKFDDWTNGKLKKWTPSEERGRVLFTGDKAKCFNCHMAEDFTNDDFKNIGLYNGKDLNDEGRYVITNNKNDKGKFKTPGLRNIAVTAPYMHNGIFKNLHQVLDYYNDPKSILKDGINLDKDLQKPLGLTQQEKEDIIAFLKTLTDRKFIAKQHEEFLFFY
jgi:cytochrome c peroxidase